MNRYFMIFDTTKEYNSPKHATYFITTTNTSITGFITEFMKQNGTELENLRIMNFETKAQYTASYQNWVKQIIN